MYKKGSVHMYVHACLHTHVHVHLLFMYMYSTYKLGPILFVQTFNFYQGV